MRSRIPTTMPIMVPFLRSVSLGGVMSNCVGYWTSRAGNVAKGRTMLDSSGNGNHGTAKNGCHWIQGEGGIFRPDTSGYVDFDDTPSIDSATSGEAEFTVLAWAYSRSTKTRQPLVTKERSRSSADTSDWGLGIGEGTIWGQISNGTDKDKVDGGSVPQNEWVHIGFVVGADKLYGFINNVEAANADRTVYNITNNYNMNIGKSLLDDGEEYFDGFMNEAMIFGSALMENQRRAHYNITRPWVLGR